MIKSIQSPNQLDTLLAIHQDNLLFVWKVRQGLSNDTAIEVLADYCAWYWKRQVVPYFSSEEKALSSFLPQDDGLVCKLKEQRNDLRELILELGNCHDTLLIGMLVSLFEFHIRFEQRIFFPYLQQRLPAPEFDVFISLITNVPASNEPWKKTFWIRDGKYHSE